MLFEEIQRWNMFRRPDWRFERVLHLAARHPQPGRCTPRDDAYVKDYHKFFLKWRGLNEEDRYKLFYEDRGMFLAHAIHEREISDPDSVLILQSQLLTDLPMVKIADEHSTHPEAVECYEAIFFNVRPYLGQRKWVMNQILIPAIMKQIRMENNVEMQASDDVDRPFGKVPVVVKPFLDATLKYFSYMGGPFVCDLLSEGIRARRIQRPEDVQRFLDESWTTNVKRRSLQASLTFEANRYNIMDLFNVHARIMEIERGAEDLEWKQNALEKHLMTAFDAMPWCVGTDGVNRGKELGLDRYDVVPAELRDHELQAVAAGGKIKAEEEVVTLRLPPPRKKDKGDKEGPKK